MPVSSYRKLLRKAVLAGVALAAALSQASANDKPTTVPPGTPVTITVTQAKPDSPKVSISLRNRQARATPTRYGCTHTGGGIIDVQQPTSDVIVVTMGATAVAYGGPKDSVASMHFDLDQCFEVSFDDPKVKRAKLTLEGRVIGLLRSHCKGGTAEFSSACATVSAPCIPPLSLSMQSHAVAGGDNLSVNDRVLSEAVQVPAADKFSLHQTFVVTASAPKCLFPHKAPSVEFAPDPALDPLWISYKEPFKGAVKKDYGFQVTVRVADDTPAEEEKKDGGDKKNNAPKPLGNGDKKNDAPKKDGNAPTSSLTPTSLPLTLPAPGQ